MRFFREFEAVPLRSGDGFELALAIEASAEVILEMKDRKFCRRRNEFGEAVATTPSEQGLMNFHARYMRQAVKSVAIDNGLRVSDLQQAREVVGRWRYWECVGYIKDWLWVRVDLRLAHYAHFVY